MAWHDKKVDAAMPSRRSGIAPTANAAAAVGNFTEINVATASPPTVSILEIIVPTILALVSITKV